MKVTFYGSIAVAAIAAQAAKANFVEEEEVANLTLAQFDSADLAPEFAS